MKKMLSLKQLYKSMPKLEVTPLEPVVINRFINEAMDRFFRVCVTCHKELPTSKGMIIHWAKMHKETYSLFKLMRVSPNRPVHVKWDTSQKQPFATKK